VKSLTPAPAGALDNLSRLAQGLQDIDQATRGLIRFSEKRDDIELGPSAYAVFPNFKDTNLKYIHELRDGINETLELQIFSVELDGLRDLLVDFKNAKRNIEVAKLSLERLILWAEEEAKARLNKLEEQE